MQSLCRVSRNFRFLRFQRLCSTRDSGKSSSDSSEFKVMKVMRVEQNKIRHYTLSEIRILASRWANKLLHERMWKMRLDRLRQRSHGNVQGFWWNGTENYSPENRGSFDADFSENGTRTNRQEGRRAFIVRKYSNQTTEIKIKFQFYLYFLDFSSSRQTELARRFNQATQIWSFLFAEIFQWELDQSEYAKLNQEDEQ